MIVGLIFLVVVAFLLVRQFLDAGKEFKSSYDFIIEKIEVTPTKKLILYDSIGVEFFSVNYSIVENDNIEIGDSISKQSCSKLLYVYKKNDKGDYQEYKRKSPSGLFPYNWFCK